MNRLILKYATPLTIVILAVFAWVIAERVANHSGILVLAITAAIVFVIGTPTFLLLWPRITVTGFKRAITGVGFSGGPVPINTLWAEPTISADSASSGSIMGTGTDDVLYVGGWLDLHEGPQVLHVPEMDARYYAVQLTDPASGANFAYVGTRATGSAAGAYLLTGPGWSGAVPDGMTRIPAPGHALLVIGRVFVADAADQPAAYALAEQIRVEPLG